MKKKGKKIPFARRRPSSHKIKCKKRIDHAELICDKFCCIKVYSMKLFIAES